MSTTARVINYVNFTGDLTQEIPYDSGDMPDSPASQEVVGLVTGNNTITLPDVEGFTLHGLAIVPPSLNEVELTFKGVSGDTGILLSATRVSVIQFGETLPASIVLSAPEDVDGFRLIWF